MKSCIVCNQPVPDSIACASCGLVAMELLALVPGRKISLAMVQREVRGRRCDARLAQLKAESDRRGNLYSPSIPQATDAEVEAWRLADAIRMRPRAEQRSRDG